MGKEINRLLIGLHHTELGGSQLNGLDMATAIRDRGYDVRVLATHATRPGPVADMVRKRGLPLTLVQHPVQLWRRGTLYRRNVARELISLVREERIDLVHAYETMIMDAFYGPHLRLGTRLVGTVYGMQVPTWLPRHAPLIGGTRKIVEAAQAAGQRAALIEPPVNTGTDDPALVDGGEFRRTYQGETLYVIVSRLDPDMKQEGIERAIDAMRSLDGRLLVIGEGPSRATLAARAHQVNAELQRQAVIIYGPLSDPRPAYAAADVVLGMGGSALRAMSFAKPLVVLGIRGFSRECTPETASYFFSDGFYGTGDGTPSPLVHQIKHVLARHGELGKWCRKTAVERYSLHVATDTLERIYNNTPVSSRSTAMCAAARTAIHKVVADSLPGSARERLRPFTRNFLRGKGLIYAA
jgi:glycosyltransferase involved in cell wall biosynthesis